MEVGIDVHDGVIAYLDALIFRILRSEHTCERGVVRSVVLREIACVGAELHAQHLSDAEGQIERGERSLIQIIGRAARNAHGEVIMYADHITDSMDKAISETNRRRAIQEKYNEEHHIFLFLIHIRFESVLMF